KLLTKIKCNKRGPKFDEVWQYKQTKIVNHFSSDNALPLHIDCPKIRYFELHEFD
ncbi:11850_t:CDS:1, partial [Rhizophagus irregularis]